MLQFGHGGEAVEIGVEPGKHYNELYRFNSATAVKPWRCFFLRVRASRALVLQFGHGGEAVEIIRNWFEAK